MKVMDIRIIDNHEELVFGEPVPLLDVEIDVESVTGEKSTIRLKKAHVIGELSNQTDSSRMTISCQISIESRSVQIQAIDAG